MVLTVDAKGGIYINDTWARMDSFEEALQAEMAEKHTSSVYLRGDSAAAYGVAISVIGRLKAMGIESIGLVTASENKKKDNGSQR